MPAKIKLLPAEPPPPELAEVQERVDRLEDAVAALCDTQSLEERIADRVAQKLTQHEIQLPPLPQPQPTAPTGASASALSAPSPTSASASAPKVQGVASGSAPVAAFAEPPAAPARAPLASLFWGMLPETSLLRDLWWDARAFWKMIRDPGYQLTWSCRTVPLAVLFYVFIMPKLTPYLGWLVPQATLGIFGIFLDIFLLYLGFKIVQRELRRYDEFALKYRR